jgi:HSP20 family protein
MALLMAPPVESRVPTARRAFDVSRYVAEEMDRLFNEFGVRTHWPFVPMTAKEDTVWMPALEVDEKDSVFRVRIDLPGMKKEDVKVDIAEGMLTIEGERKQEDQRKEKDYYRTERSYGRFARTITVPEGAQLDTAKASFADGVLEITMSVKTAERPTARQLVIG